MLKYLENWKGIFEDKDCFDEPGIEREELMLIFSQMGFGLIQSLEHTHCKFVHLLLLGRDPELGVRMVP